MNKGLRIALFTFSAIACFIVLFPFRTASYKLPGKIDSSASLGPTFILSNPSKAVIYEAIFERRLNDPDTFTYKMALQSKIDLERTMLFLSPFIVGAAATMYLLRKAKSKRSSDKGENQ